MLRRFVFLAAAQLGALGLGLRWLGCPSCAPLDRLDLLPIATTELPWLAVLAQLRAATEPGDAVVGIAWLALTGALGLGTFRWMLRGGRVSGALVLAGWLAWWSVGIVAATEVHASREHERCCC